MKPVRAVAIALAALLAAACGSDNVVSEGADSRLMLKGFDPVAYFTAGKPARGDPGIKAEHGGVTYRFASEAHKREFLAAPERYVPQFGGFCANGMVYAIPLGGDPEVFMLVGGRLYVFGGQRSRQYFEMDQERNLRFAHAYWDSEVKQAHWRLQSWKRVWWDRVPHYKTNAELAAEYERRTRRKPG